MLKVVHAKGLEAALVRKVEAAKRNARLSFGTDSRGTSAHIAACTILMCIQAQEQGGCVFYCEVRNTDTTRVCYFVASSEMELVELSKEWEEDSARDHQDPWGLLG